MQACGELPNNGQGNFRATNYRALRERKPPLRPKSQG